MNNNISSMNNVNFKAKLDVTRVKGSKQRWQNIAKMFEEKTKSSPNDVFLIEGSFKKGLYLNLLEENGEYSIMSEVDIVPDATARLKNVADKEIVKNIVDIFKYLKEEITYENKFMKLFNYLNLKFEKLDEEQGTDFLQRFDDFRVELRSAIRDNFKSKHLIFQKDGIFI